MYCVDSSFLLRIRRADHSWRITLMNLKTGERLDFTSWPALQRHLRALPPSPSK